MCVLNLCRGKSKDKKCQEDSLNPAVLFKWNGTQWYINSFVEKKSGDAYLTVGFWITIEAFVPLSLASETCFRNA